MELNHILLVYFNLLLSVSWYSTGNSEYPIVYSFTQGKVGMWSYNRIRDYKNYTKMSEVDLSAFIYRLFHEDFSSIVGTNTVLHCADSIVPTIEEKSV